eukprot:571434-Pleurochrysis_carterae.AAC.1
MDVRRAGGVVDACRIQELGELGGEKLVGIIAVHGADRATRGVRSLVQECVKQEVNGFETRMIVDKNKQVLETGVLGAHERSGDVGVDESTSVR